MSDTIKIIVESLPKNNPDIIMILSGLLTPLIAVITAYIAWQQHKVNKNRLKNELYDRRAEVYAELDLFLTDFIRQGYTTFERSHKFYFQIARSRFLFKKDIQDYLQKIYKKSLECYNLQLKMYPERGQPGLPVGSERSKVANDQCEIIKWVSNQKINSIEIFKKYFELK